MAFNRERTELAEDSFDGWINASSKLARRPGGVDVLIRTTRADLEAPMADLVRRPRFDPLVHGLVQASDAFPARKPEILDLLTEVIQAPERSSLHFSAASSIVDIDPTRAREILSDTAKHFGHKTSFGIAHGLRQLAERVPESGASLVMPLQLLLDGEEFLVPDQAAEALSYIDDDSAFEALLGAVGAGREGYRLLRSLLASPRAALHKARLIPVLERFADSDSLGSYEAAQKMAEYPSGAQRLRTILARPGTHSAALRALAGIQDRDSVPLLVEKLRGDDAVDVSEIVSALGEIGDPTAVPQIADELHRLGTPLAAARALTQLGPTGVSILIANFEAPDPAVRGAVSAALREHREEVIPVLLQSLRGADARSKARVARIVGSLDEPSTKPQLFKLFHDKSPVVRIAAVDAVGMMSSKPPITALSQLLHDAVPEVRAAAARVIPVTSQATQRKITSLLRDSDAVVRLAATEVLGASNRASALAGLIGRLGDTDAQVRARAAESLAVGGRSAIPTLNKLLGGSDAAVRDAAAQALARLGKDGRRSLMRAVSDSRGEVRKAVASAAEFLDDDLLPSTIKLLDDPETTVRVTAAQGLARRSARNPLPPASASVGLDLVDALGNRPLDSTDLEQRWAMRALVAIRSEELGPAVAAQLASALRNADKGLARAASSAIRSNLVRPDAFSQPLPGWLRVVDAGDSALTLSPSALDVISALQVAAANERTVPSAARLALTSVHTALVRERQRLFQERARIAFDRQMAYRRTLDRVERPKPPDELNQLMQHLEAESAQLAGRPRYLDATFLDEAGPLPNGSALHEGRRYSLEVAIRISPRGLPVVGDDQPFPGPDVEVDEAEITVVVEVEDAGLKVDRNLATLTLPRAGDSTRNATFIVTPSTPTLHPNARATLRLRLYYEFCLLESALIRAEVVSKFTPDVRSTFDAEQPITLEHDRFERGYEGLAREIPRALHIDVTWREAGYGLQFTWGQKNGKQLSIPTELSLTRSALTTYLGDARKALVEVTMGGPYATELHVSDATYAVAMRRLAQAGRDLHTIMFRGELDSALTRVGRLLAKSPLPSGAVVQISTDTNASDFVFPWALMYDKQMPAEEYETPDPDGFWGARYCLEQRVPVEIAYPATSKGAREGARMSLMLWDQFRNASAHSSALASLAEASHGKLELQPPITRASDALAALVPPSESDIFYFYTHAHTREPEGEDVALASALKLLARKTPEYQGLKDVYDRARLEYGKESWIKLTHGQLKLRSLEEAEVQFSNAPLVFLNACESGRLTPTLERESFVNFFLSRGASAFVGTECTMTIVFGQAFGELVLQQLLAGNPIGSAILASRQEFLRQKNPLGLAYSLYGDAGKSFQSDSIARKEVRYEHSQSTSRASGGRTHRVR